MNSERIQFSKLLKKHGYSLTEPRKQIFKRLSSRNAVSINQLIASLPYDRSTIYRTIDLFQELGIVVEVHLGWKHKFELSDMFQHHHHHLTCINCKQTIPLPEDQQLEQAIALLGKKYSFKPLDHQIELTGICASCQTKSRTPAK